MNIINKFKSIFVIAVCICMAVSSVQPAHASVREAEKAVETAEAVLDKDIDGKKEIKEKILKTSREMKQLSKDLDRLDKEWTQMDRKREKQYGDMKLRIQYMYENGDSDLVSLLLFSDSISSALNKAECTAKLAEYDRDKLAEYEETLKTLSEKQEKIMDDISQMEKLQKKQKKLKEQLAKKIHADKQNLEEAEQNLEKAVEEEKRKEEERKKIAAAAAASYSSAETHNSSSAGSGLSYSGIYNTGAARLTRSSGVAYYNGHRETYYSQRVLPGGGLNIPGRHVAQDGTIRDRDGYICVAAAPGFKPRGSTLMTTLGPAKVYDSGCAYGTIDIYVNW